MGDHVSITEAWTASGSSSSADSRQRSKHFFMDIPPFHEMGGCSRRLFSPRFFVYREKACLGGKTFKNHIAGMEIRRSITAAFDPIQ